MKKFSTNSERSERRPFSSGSGTTSSGIGSGTTKQRSKGRSARMSTGGIAPSKPTPPLRSSSPTIPPLPSPATKAMAVTVGPTPEKNVQQRYPSPLKPTKTVGFDFGVDVVQWQSSQTTNPALINLLKEASSEESALRFESPSSRISPSWQHSPAKLSTSSTTPRAGPSPSASKYSSLGSVSFSDMIVDSQSTSGRMRIRPSTSKSAFTSPTSHSHDQQHSRQRNVKSTEDGDNSLGSSLLFSSSDPSQILEMMRGVSAMIDENMAVNTPDVKFKGKETATDVSSITARRIGRSLSSMDIDVSMDGFRSGCAYGDMGQGKVRERDAIKIERRGSMMAIDDASADADVSMGYASAMMDSPEPLDILRSIGVVSRRREVLPPPISASNVKAMPPRAGASSSSTSGRQVQNADRGCSAVASTSVSVLSTAAADINDGSTPEEPQIKMHQLLREKEHQKEIKRSQSSSPLSIDADIGKRSLTPSTLPTKMPLTRSASGSIIPTASQSVRPTQSPFLPPNASQSSHQNPPRLGMCRSRTAPSPLAGNNAPLGASPVSTTSNAGFVANKGNPSKQLAKPFKPPSRAISGPAFFDHGSQQSTSHAAQHGHSQRNTPNASHDYAMSSSSNSSRAAYPSPSPNSDDDGKKEKESEIGSGVQEELASARLFMQVRSRSPPTLPPTPESVLNGGSGPGGQEDTKRGKSEPEGLQGRDDLDEEMEEMEGADPDSSYGHISLGIDIDALEETMRMFD